MWGRGEADLAWKTGRVAAVPSIVVTLEGRERWSVLEATDHLG